MDQINYDSQENTDVLPRRKWNLNNEVDKRPGVKHVRDRARYETQGET